MTEDPCRPAVPAEGPQADQAPADSLPALAGPAPKGPASSTRDSDARHAAAGGGTNLLAILAGLAQPLYHGAVARIYGAATYGLYALGWGIIDVVARMGMLGSDKGAMRYIPAHRVAGEPELARRSLGTAFWVALISAALLGGIAVVLAGPLAALQHKPETATAIRLLAPSAPFAALVVVLISATMAAKVVRYNLYVRGLAQPLLLLAVAAPVGLLSASLEGLCLSHLVATALTMLYALWAVRRVFDDASLVRQLRGRPLHWELVRYSLPMGISEFLNAVLQRADLIILGFFVPEAAVGIYAGAELLSRAVSNARYAFDPVALPVISEALRQNDRQRLAYNLKLMTRWVILLTFPVVGFTVGFREELLALFGPAFLAATAPFLVLNAGHLVNGGLGSVGWVLAMSGRSRLFLLNNLVGAVVNVVISLVLIGRVGIIGAAVAAAVAATCANLMQLVEVGLLERVHPFSMATLRVVVAGAAMLAAMIYMVPLWLAPGWGRVAAGTVGMLLFYGTLLRVLGLGPEERELVARAVARLRGRR